MDMPMAEPRRRRKWTLNPRGSLWANDDSKFGQKLMEKMGWSKGRGLGREEQGRTEHIAVKHKDDSKGIGYKGSDDEWIKHYEGFEDVLASLNSQNNTNANSNTENTAGNTHTDNTSASASEPDTNTITKTSLEQSSKASKVRVHYHKFTRSKDLSRLSADDLGCILGSKRAKQLAKEKEVEVVEEAVVAVDEVGHVDHSMGVTTIKGCSIQDYFAQKMEALKNRAKGQPQGLAEEEEEEGRPGFGLEEEGRPGFGLSLDMGDTLKNGDRNTEGRKKKKRKKRQMETEEDNSAETQIEECSDDVPKKKKKKRFDGSSVYVVNASTSEDKEVRASNEDSTRKKKRKRPDFSNVYVVNGNTSDDKAVRRSNEDNNQKKKKKKRSEGSHIYVVNGNAREDKAVRRSNEDNTTIGDQETTRKKAKRKHSDTTPEEEALGTITEEQSVVKKKKKKKKKHTDASGEDSGSQLLTIEETPKKKKKRKGRTEQ